MKQKKTQKQFHLTNFFFSQFFKSVLELQTFFNTFENVDSSTLKNYSFYVDSRACVRVGTDVAEFYVDYTLSGSIGKVVTSHAEGCKIKSQLWLNWTDLYYAPDTLGILPMRLRGGVTVNWICCL